MKPWIDPTAGRAVLSIAGPIWPPILADLAAANQRTVSAVVTDYLALRKIGMALAVIGFLLGLARLGASDGAAERQKAEALITLTLFIFAALAGDRFVAQGLAKWFELPVSALPAFWQ